MAFNVGGNGMITAMNLANLIMGCLLVGGLSLAAPMFAAYYIVKTFFGGF